MAKLLIYPESDTIEGLMAQARRILKQASAFRLINPDLDVAIEYLVDYHKAVSKHQLENYFSILDQISKWEKSL